MKPQRWYKVENNRLYVYNAHTAGAATSVSVTDKKDIDYYRNNFTLAKLWEVSEVETECYYND